MKDINYIIYIEDDLYKKKNIYYTADKKDAYFKFYSLLNECIMKAYESIGRKENNYIFQSNNFKSISLSNREKILIRSKEYVVYINDKGKIIGAISFASNFCQTYIERVVMDII